NLRCSNLAHAVPAHKGQFVRAAFVMLWLVLATIPAQGGPPLGSAVSQRGRQPVMQKLFPAQSNAYMIRTPAMVSPPDRSAVVARVGIVNLEDAIVATSEGQKEFTALKTRFLPRQKELENLKAEVERVKADLQANGDKLNEEQRATQVKTLEGKQEQLQHDDEDFKTKFDEAEKELVNRIGGKMRSELEKYAKAHDYTMMLDVSDPKTPVL